MTEFDNLFLAPWMKETSNAFVDELHKEVSKEHVLYGAELEVMARRTDEDSVLFKFKEMNDQYVQVHLTWKRKEEENPLWPKFQIYHSFEDWENTVMKQDHTEYEES